MSRPVSDAVTPARFNVLASVAAGHVYLRPDGVFREHRPDPVRPGKWRWRTVTALMEALILAGMAIVVAGAPAVLGSGRAGWRRTHITPDGRATLEGGPAATIRLSTEQLDVLAAAKTGRLLRMQVCQDTSAGIFVRPSMRTVTVLARRLDHLGLFDLDALRLTPAGVELLRRYTSESDRGAA